MVLTAIAIWAFLAGTGSTIAADVGGPSIQSFGSTASTPWSDPDGKGWGYKTQYNAGPNATGSALITGVHNATKIFAEFTFRTGSTAPVNGEVLFAIGQDENSLGNMRIGCWYNGSEIRFRVNGSDIFVPTSGTALSVNTYYRLAVAYDAGNATASLRARMWLNDAEISGTASVTLNTAITIDTSTDELVCGAPFGPGTVNNAGYSHHLALYSFDSIDGTAVLAGLAALDAADGNDVVDPFDTGGGGDVTGTGSVDVAATASGSGGVTLQGTGAPNVEATVSGSGQEVLAGTGAPSVAATVSGSGQEVLAGAGAPNVSAGASGSGQAILQGSGSFSVSVEVSGSEGDLPVTGTGSVSTGATVAGSGAMVLPGTGAPSVAAGVSGGGQQTLQGAGAPNVSAGASGSGFVDDPTVSGTGSADVSAGAQGAGGMTIQGSVSADVAVTVLSVDEVPEPPIEWDLVAEGIRAIIQATSGVQTEWDNQNQKAVSDTKKQKIRLTASGIERVNRDYVRERMQAGVLVADIRGQRSFRITILWETHSLKAGGGAQVLENLDILLTKLRNRASIKAQLDALNCGIADATDPTDASFVFDDRVHGAAYAELLFNTTREILGTVDDSIDWIETVNAEADIRIESPTERPPTNWQLAPKE